MNTVFDYINSSGTWFVDFAAPMLLQSSVLVMILLLVDLVLRKKVRAVFRYCMWMLILVKLVLPSSLSSPVGIGNWLGYGLTTIPVAKSPVADNHLVNENLPFVPNAEAVQKTSVVKPAFDVSPVRSDIASQTQPAKIAATLTWQGGVFLFWLVVAAAMGLLLLQRAVFVCGLIRQAKQANNLMNDTLRFCCGQMGIKRNVGLKISANATSPAVCGLFGPVILIPENLGSDFGVAGLRAVILHELAHIKRFDLWVNLLQTILQIVYFYNPFIWLANWIIRRVREQAVDEMVLVTMGEKAQQYPETLINIARLAFKRPALSLRLIGVVESKSALAQRIKHILNRPIPKSAKLGILSLAVILISAAVLLPMAQAVPPPEFVIKGTVTDAQTGKPIAGAKVGDVEAYAGGKQSTVTDANGNYEYKTWYEEHATKCEAAGYKTKIEGLLTKFFGTEKERIFDFALEKATSSDKTDYSSVTVTEGVGFDDIIVGDSNCTKEFIKSKLGVPEEDTIDSVSSGWFLNYRKKYGLDFWLDNKNVLQEIRLNPGFRGKLTSGISMYSSKEDVFGIYGMPIREVVAEDKDFDKGFENQVLFYRKGLVRKSDISKIYYNKSKQDWLLFWFKGDKINQIVTFPNSEKTEVASGQTSQQPEKFIAELPNGVTVELVGVCDYPEDKPRCWGPDGTESKEKLYVKRERDYSNEKLGFIIKVDGPEDLSFAWNEIKSSQGYWGSCTVLDESGNKVKGYEAAVTRNLNADTTDIRIGVATKPWQTIVTHNGRGMTTTGSNNILFSQAYESDNFVTITASSPWRKDQVERIIAIDKNGQPHVSKNIGSIASGEIDQMTAKFYDLKLSDIVEFQFQTRPYEWVEFKNVSLKPNLKTDVQIRTGEQLSPSTSLRTGSGAGEESQKMQEIMTMMAPGGGPSKKKMVANDANMMQMMMGPGTGKQYNSEIKEAQEQLIKRVESKKQRYEELLQNRISMDFREWDSNSLTVQYAVLHLCEYVEVPYQFEKSQKLAGEKIKQRIKPGLLSPMPARLAILHILEPLGLTFGLDENGLYIYQIGAEEGGGGGIQGGNELKTGEELQNPAAQLEVADAGSKNKFQELMNHKVTVNVEHSPDGNRLTVQYAAIAICEAVGIPYQWDKSQKFAGEKAKRYIEPIHFKDVTAEKAITDVLNPLALTYDLDANGLYLVTVDKSNKGGRQ
jgi:beta-lactamase regulating signal transducer with metallopeptidase domain